MQIKNDWIKSGVIFSPKDLNNWITSHAYVPTPFLLNDEVIRIFAAFRDTTGVGRVGYVDVAAENPMKIISLSSTPCLNIGLPGAFDDNGVTPISIVKHKNNLYLYYMGWQLSDKIRYLLFAGLAVSTDMGNSFTRLKNVPILERTDKEFFLRSAPWVLKQGKKWHMIYPGGNSNISIDNKILPSYSLKYLSSNHGTNWAGKPHEIFMLNKTEYGFGRPFFIHENGIYKLWYSIRSFNEKYRLGYAESLDLQKWTRLDHQLDLFTNNAESYEDQMQAFAAIIQTKYGNYMFYNGNDYGKTGICFARQRS